jgi:hypothetical protein
MTFEEIMRKYQFLEVTYINTYLRSFELYFSVNQKTEKTILHMSINSNPKNVLTDE